RHDIGAVDRLRRGDTGTRGDLLRRGRDGDPQDVAGKALLQLLQVALEDLPGARDQADLVAELFGLLEHVRREDDGLAAGAEVRQVILDEGRVDRVEAGEDLVQDEQL